jgi:plastocyanin
MSRKATFRSAAFAFTALAALVATSVAPAAGTSTVTISHQMRGCHMWQLGKASPKPSLSVTLRAGTVLRFVNNDVMPHRLIQRSGPKLRLTHASMNRLSAATSVKLTHKGVYRFTTKAGEDYPWMSSMKTIGEDYVLHLTVHVK